MKPNNHQIVGYCNNKNSKHGKQKNYLKNLKGNTSAPSFKPHSNVNQKLNKKKSALSLALEEYKSKKAENHKRKEEFKQKKEEMKKALDKYKDNKSKKLKRMSRKTKKGQPIMKYWMESILEKIQNTS